MGSGFNYWSPYKLKTKYTFISYKSMSCAYTGTLAMLLQVQLPLTLSLWLLLNIVSLLLLLLPSLGPKP